MGFRVAERATARGATVVLVSGPSAEPLPRGVEVLRVQTAAEMKDAILGRLDVVDVVVMAAAVADISARVGGAPEDQKNEKPLALKLVRTDDILMAVARGRKKDQTIVGFAAETESLEANAQEKLAKKKLDLIVANDVSRPNSGFEVETNEATLFRADGGVRKLPLMTKLALADEILDEIRDYRGGR